MSVTAVTTNRGTVQIELTKLARTVGGFERTDLVYVVTIGKYRAELPACLRDDCTAGKLTPCRKANGHIETVNAWLKHCQTYCHGWHEASVERFALDVLATYGAGVRASTVNTTYGNEHHASRTVGVPRGKIRPGSRVAGSFMHVPGWPDPEARAW